jgi:alkylation response protein AidB-like acyl-CoA dehydrogenase
VSTPSRDAPPPPALRALRDEVRRFLDDQRGSTFLPRCDSWLTAWDEGFSRRLADRGWVGMTVPRRYGGQERHPVERYVVAEELVAAGAPVAAHWIADRQTAPALLAHGTEEQRLRFLPAIARAECFFAIGMSEPDAGSDLSAVRTRAVRTSDGWSLTGTKTWTSGAHRAHYFFVLVRTAPATDDRHAGLTQFIVDLRAPGVTIRPIPLLTGEHHFNEVTLDDVRVADGMRLGEVGHGWATVTAELAWERSGPERFLSTVPLLRAVCAHLASRDGLRTETAFEQIGMLLGRLDTLRRLSGAVVADMSAGRPAGARAALVKDLGTRFEQDVAEICPTIVDVAADPAAPPGTLPRLLADGILHSPGFTIRGGTTEVLRGIVAKSLGRDR